MKDEEPRTTTVQLTEQEIINVLRAYDRLSNASPLFKFNDETKKIIDKLAAALLDVTHD